MPEPRLSPGELPGAVKGEVQRRSWQEPEPVAWSPARIALWVSTPGCCLETPLLHGFTLVTWLRGSSRRLHMAFDYTMSNANVFAGPGYYSQRVKYRPSCLFFKPSFTSLQPFLSTNVPLLPHSLYRRLPRYHSKFNSRPGIC